MAVVETAADMQTASGARSMAIDKQWLIQKLAETNPLLDSASDAAVTLDQVHQMMLADGIRPEDNSFSREIIRSRYPDDFE